MSGWRVFPQEPGPRPSSLSKSWLSRRRWNGSIDAWCARGYKWQKPGPREKRTRFVRDRWLLVYGLAQRTGRSLKCLRSPHRGLHMSHFRYKRMMADILK